MLVLLTYPRLPVWLLALVALHTASTLAAWGPQPVDQSSQVLRGLNSAVCALGSSGDGTTLVAADLQGNVKVWRRGDRVFFQQEGFFSVFEATYTVYLRGTKTFKQAESDDYRHLDTGLMLDEGYYSIDGFANGEWFPSRDELHVPARVTSIEVCESGSRVIVAGHHIKPALWDLDTMKLLSRFEVVGVKSAAFLGDGETLAAMHGDGSLGIYDSTTGAMIRRSISNSKYSWLAASRDSHWLVTGGSGGEISVLRSETLAVDRVYETGASETCHGSFAEDSTKILLAGKNAEINSFWIPHIITRQDRKVHLFVPKNQTIVAPSIRWLSFGYDATSILLESRWDSWMLPYSPREFEDYNGRQGRRYLAQPHRPFTIDFWMYHSGFVVLEHKTQAVIRLLEGHAFPIQAVTWIGDSNDTVASGSSDLTVRVWDLNEPLQRWNSVTGPSIDHSTPFRLEPAQALETSSVFSEARMVAHGNEGFILVGDVPRSGSEQELLVISRDGKLVNKLRTRIHHMSSDGKWAVGSIVEEGDDRVGDGLALIECWTCEVAVRFPEHVTVKGFSGDGQRCIASIGGRGIAWFTPCKGQWNETYHSTPWSLPESALDFSISRTGSRIAIVHRDGIVSLHDANSGTEVSRWARFPTGDQSLSICHFTGDSESELVCRNNAGIFWLHTATGSGSSAWSMSPGIATDLLSSSLPGQTTTFLAADGSFFAENVVSFRRRDGLEKHWLRASPQTRELNHLSRFAIPMPPGGHENPVITGIPGKDWVLAHSAGSWAVVLDGKGMHAILDWDAHARGEPDEEPYRRGDNLNGCGRVFDVQGGMLAACASADGEVVATFGGDKMFRVWRISDIARGIQETLTNQELEEDGRLFYELPEVQLPQATFGLPVSMCLIGKLGHYATLHKDGTVAVWGPPNPSAEAPEWSTRVLLESFKLEAKIAASSDGSLLAIIPYDGPPEVWQWRTARKLSLGKLEDQSAFAAAMSPDGSQFALAFEEKIVFGRADGSPPKSVPLNTIGGCRSPFLSWTPDGESLIYWASRNLIVFDGTTRRQSHSFEIEASDYSEDPLVFSADGKWAVAITRDSEVFAIGLAKWTIDRIPPPSANFAEGELKTSQAESWMGPSAIVHGLEGLAIQCASVLVSLRMGPDPRLWTARADVMPLFDEDLTIHAQMTDGDWIGSDSYRLIRLDGRTLVPTSVRQFGYGWWQREYSIRMLSANSEAIFLLGSSHVYLPLPRLPLLAPESILAVGEPVLIHSPSATGVFVRPDGFAIQVTSLDRPGLLEIPIGINLRRAEWRDCAVAVSNNGRYLAVVTPLHHEGSYAQVWRIRWDDAIGDSDDPEWTVLLNHQPSIVCVSDSGTGIAVPNEQSIELWVREKQTVESRPINLTISEDDSCHRLAFSPTGEVILVWCRQSRVQAFRVEGLQPIAIPKFLARVLELTSRDSESAVAISGQSLDQVAFSPGSAFWNSEELGRALIEGSSTYTLTQDGSLAIKLGSEIHHSSGYRNPLLCVFDPMTGVTRRSIGCSPKLGFLLGTIESQHFRCEIIGRAAWASELNEVKSGSGSSALSLESSFAWVSPDREHMAVLIPASSSRERYFLQHFEIE